MFSLIGEADRPFWPDRSSLRGDHTVLPGNLANTSDSDALMQRDRIKAGHRDAAVPSTRESNSVGLGG